ncbi:hypothetical protein CHLRE_06g308100v5 [Chlamydomonas reinhardtii]|uniref:Uncharacterized protein n=1 Tax=Chlamydomonas reinhardtii TaxID=3055 RepID=A0A2K3DRF6_CHLRE|nr:uncharacterized protein CHLRE_06g308100v5 [Chlamydomonas reinhardtii]PNW83135.1 hypothetical protein CHLRE_06g308100v5 [Chlamydomonas reinhardtii]
MDVAASSGQIDIVSLRNRKHGTYTHKYTPRDAMLYALGLGCSTTCPGDLRYIYEGAGRSGAAGTQGGLGGNQQQAGREAGDAGEFAVLPTYAIVAAHPALGLVPLESYLPGGLDRAGALHGEQYLQLLAPLPAEGGQLVSRPELVDMQAKGKGLVVVLRTVTTDAVSGRDVAINEFTTFILGKGDVRTPWPPAPRLPAAVAPNEPPARAPDAVAELATSRDQAALYRLSGDFNPLHIDPQVSARVGFQQPILHGLCSMGISVRLVLRRFGGDDPARLKSVKVRFAKPVLPGETLRVEMWAEPSAPPPDTDTSADSASASMLSRREAAPLKVVFRTWAVERKALAIANAAVELHPEGPGAVGAGVAPRPRL